MWAVGRSLGFIGPDSDLGDAEEWFTGDRSATSAIVDADLRVGSAILQSGGQPTSLGPILPYVLDLHAPGTRREAIRDPSNLNSRSRRKQSGVFYTPGDVARFIVASAIDRWCGSGVPSVFDPACGSGVFLRAAFWHLVGRGWRTSEVLDHLFGCDISLAAIESSAFVLTHDALQVDRNLDPLETWKRIRKNLTCGNSLLIPTSCSNATVLQEPSQQTRLPMDRFDVVVANPPYAQLGADAARNDLEYRFDVFSGGISPGSDRYIPFLEFMWILTNDSGVASMVVPLSVAYNSQSAFARLRGCMQNQAGKWSFLFFDRTPDAIFGDDVKQRAAIVLLEKNREAPLLTSSVLRWTSRTRQTIFSWDTVVPFHGSILGFIPKLGSAWETTEYQTLQASTQQFSEDWIETRRVSIGEASRNSNLVFVAGTAYNWLSVMRDPCPAQQGLVSPSESPMLMMRFASPHVADFAYGLLCSRLVYWLWRVESDCFHVQRQFLGRLPVSSATLGQLRVTAIADAARRLWASVVETPVRSVNGGRETIGYCPHGQVDLLDAIDQQLAVGLGLSTATVERLRDFVYANSVVDPRDRERVAVGGRALTAWRM